MRRLHSFERLRTPSGAYYVWCERCGEVRDWRLDSIRNIEGCPPSYELAWRWLRERFGV